MLALGFFSAFFLVLFATPSLIKVAKLKHLVDEPSDDRKLHHKSIPTIGGIMIFAGTIFAYSMWFPSQGDEQLGVNYNVLSALQEFKFLVASMFVLFFLGLKDDIIGVSPSKKLMTHLLVGFILVLMADIRITGLHGIFNVYEIPMWASIMFSIFVYIVIVNAINLIDGIDGLASGLGFISCMAFAYWFQQAGDLPLSLLAVALGGSLLAFLFFNFSPAKIFMGDSGSLTIGIVLYVLAVKSIELDISHLPATFKGISRPVLAMAILGYPLLDTLRVFIVRTLRGRSPFSADRNHIHHQLHSGGLNHRKTVYILYLFSIILIALPFFMPPNSPNISLLVVGGVAILISQLIFIFTRRAKRKIKQKASEQK